jgi:hypothetical protein
MRVLVCGSRNFNDRKLMVREFDKLPTDVVIIHGGAWGADKMAEEMALARGMRVECYHADWKAHGKAAGPIRNQRMIDEGKPDLVLAFPRPGSKGTWDMVNRAKKAGVEVHVVARVVRKDLK